MNIYHGLLFSSGHVADPELALSLAQAEAPAEPAKIEAPRPNPRPNRLRWLFEELAMLGGRPVSSEHLDDLEEPFPPLHPGR